MWRWRQSGSVHGGVSALDPDGDGARGLAVHHGRAVPGPHGDLVCFSGRGPGEVFLADRKVMGISQWRSREGSLFHTCAYAHWDPRPLIDLLDVGSPRREALLRDLPQAATGILDPGLTSVPVLPAPPVLQEMLLTTFATWEKGAPPRPL